MLLTLKKKNILKILYENAIFFVEYNFTFSNATLYKKKCFICQV